MQTLEKTLVKIQDDDDDAEYKQKFLMNSPTRTHTNGLNNREKTRDRKQFRAA